MLAEPKADETEVGEVASFQFEPPTTTVCCPTSDPENPKLSEERDPSPETMPPKWPAMPLSKPTEWPDTRCKSLRKSPRLAWNCSKTTV